MNKKQDIEAVNKTIKKYEKYIVLAKEGKWEEIDKTIFSFRSCAFCKIYLKNRCKACPANYSGQSIGCADNPTHYKIEERLEHEDKQGFIKSVKTRIKELKAML